MRYTPYSESEIQSMHVMEEGIYPFQVIEVHTIDKNGNPMTDRNGNDMAKLKLMVCDKDNKERTLYTYISGDGNFAYKLRHFAKTLGMIEDYESGLFNIHKTLNKDGFADIVIKKGTMKSDGTGEMWPDRNDVKDFVLRPEPIYPKPDNRIESPVKNDALLDDEIPF